MSPRRSASVEFAHATVTSKWLGGLFVGLIGYLLLSLSTPLGWHLLVWRCLAFGVAPALIGVAIGRPSAPRSGIVAAFWCALLAMFVYSSIGMVRAHARLESSSDSGAIFLIGFLVSVVYGVLAGAVAAVANAVLSRMGGNRA